MSTASTKRVKRRPLATDIVIGNPRTHKFPRTLLLVADGAAANLYNVEPVTFVLTPVPRGSYTHSSKPSRSMVSDRPGRAVNAATGRHHALAPHQSPHQAAEDRFLQRVARAINARAERRTFDELIVAAPPKAIAVLRNSFSRKVAKAVALEITHEWGKLSPPAMTKRLISLLIANKK